ncbi:MAG TPA: hypothetical protein DCX54_09935 [Flavobacteriales bacterium]|nr:hypothetical protein [Flavobacteriales bacterium]
MKKIGYYFVRLIIWIFSLVPFWLLYAISDFLAFAFYRFGLYRKKMILTNLKLAFPEKSETEIKQICKDFYKNFSDILLEGIKGFSMTGDQIVKRYVIEKNLVIEKFQARKQSFIATTAHLANWEWGVSATGLYFDHRVLGVYKKLSHTEINNFVEKSRSLYNVTLSEMSDTAKLLSTKHNLDPFALVLIADQRPSNPRKAFWTHFLNRETAFFYGAEKFAFDYGYPVFFFEIIRVKRGHYRVKVDVLCEDPGELSKGDIILRYRDKLEDCIKKRPEQWLWSHNRWKHQRPEGMPIQD